MTNLTLAIDIGNTTIECGIFSGERLILDWRMSSVSNRTPDECWQVISFFLKEGKIKRESIRDAAIASVVPAQTNCFFWVFKEYLKIKPLLISYESCPFLKIDYKNPQEVGADRLCNSFAGFYYYKGPLIIVDFGTAVTFDVVSKAGSYLGGIIIPGPVTIANSLHKGTSQLPRVTIDFPDNVIGQSTDHAIQAGLSWGIIDMVDGLLNRLKLEIGGIVKVVSTGGLVDSFAKRSRLFGDVHQGLVLEGVRLIYKKWKEYSNAE